MVVNSFAFVGYSIREQSILNVNRTEVQEKSFIEYNAREVVVSLKLTKETTNSMETFFDHVKGIINNSHSPYARLTCINFGDCKWTDGFWADKVKLCEEVMVPHMGDILKGDIGHAYNNFKVKGKWGGVKLSSPETSIEK